MRSYNMKTGNYSKKLNTQLLLFLNFILVHHESNLAAKVAEKKILTLTSQVTERDEEIRQLKEELHKRTKGIV